MQQKKFIYTYLGILQVLQLFLVGHLTDFFCKIDSKSLINRPKNRIQTKFVDLKYFELFWAIIYQGKLQQYLT